MFKNVASQKLVVFAFDSTTSLPKTGDAANLTAYVSKDYGSVTVLADTSATEMSSSNAAGYYLFDLAQAETNGDCLTFTVKSSTSNIVVMAVPAVVFTLPPNFTATAISAGGVVNANATAINSVSTVAVTTVNAVIGTTINPPTFDIAVASATAGTITLASTDAYSNAVPDVDQYTYWVFQVVGGTGTGQIVQTTTATAGARTYNVLSGTMTTQLDNTSQLLSLGSTNIQAINRISLAGFDSDAIDGLAVIGQTYFTDNALNADLNAVLGTTLTEGAAGRLAGGIVKWFNVATPTGTLNSLPGAVPGASSGLLIAGFNATTTFSNLSVTTNFDIGGTWSLNNLTVDGAFSVSGGVLFESFGVTTDFVVGGAMTLVGVATASNPSNNIQVNVKAVNSTPLDGTGVVGDEWRPA